MRTLKQHIIDTAINTTNATELHELAKAYYIFSGVDALTEKRSPRINPTAMKEDKSIGDLYKDSRKLQDEYETNSQSDSFKVALKEAKTKTIPKKLTKAQQSAITVIKSRVVDEGKVSAQALVSTIAGVTGKSGQFIMNVVRNQLTDAYTLIKGSGIPDNAIHINTVINKKAMYIVSNASIIRHGIGA